MYILLLLLLYSYYTLLFKKNNCHFLNGPLEKVDINLCNATKIFLTLQNCNSNIGENVLYHMN